LNSSIIPYQVLNFGKRPDLSSIPKNCPIELKNLVLACWAENPAERPSFEEILKILSRIFVNN
jgi:Protein tyrosine kinase.